MYSLETIKALNNRPARVINHTNVDCGFNETKQGTIIHSASLRSTLVLTSDDAKREFKQWRGRKQRNVWIERFFRSGCPFNASAAVLADKHKGWTIKASVGKIGVIYGAECRTHGSLKLRLADTSARGLNRKLS